MNEAITLKINGRGIFRQYLSEAAEFSLPQGSTLLQVRHALVAYLKEKDAGFDPGFLSDSVFADEMNILSEDMAFDSDVTLTILPPVCGG